MDKTEPGMLGKIKQKLIDTKQKWAADGRLLTGEGASPQAPEGRRLPPGQRLVKDWPVLDLGVQPLVSPRDWKLSVGGAVENLIAWSFQDFMAQPQVEIVSDIHCVTGWSRYDNRWQGVSIKHFLSVVRPKPGATALMLHGHDGYTTNVRLETIDQDDVLIAHSWEGKPLTREHGGPVRLVMPRKYFWKSAKWLKHIAFLDKDGPGFWEARGYHMDGDPWREERYG
ncbi:MAG: sulfite oxidase-like oxidoreductase [Alphaproteobacteria bacterium]|nr:sulfite oxidase-like oxidoreductase [Alphaproteobacteria bacterium]